MISRGNLSSAERAGSALVGLGFALLATSRIAPLVRVICGVVAGSLLARAAAGHCGVKAALQGRTLDRERSRAVDESVLESFPASDAPASRLPDEPPSNAEAKWAAARAAGQMPR